MIDHVKHGGRPVWTSLGIVQLLDSCPVPAEKKQPAQVGFEFAGDEGLWRR